MTNASEPFSSTAAVTCRAPLTATDVHSMSFSGCLLRRGFWLYIWKIATSERTVFYVGRTGDSSSPHANSPFNRIGQHLDFRAKAKGNALARNLKAAAIDPVEARFDMMALGPVYPEAKDMTGHAPRRDVMAALENQLARFLRGRGYGVLGIHRTKKVLDTALWEKVSTLVAPHFPPLQPGSEHVTTRRALYGGPSP